MLGEGQEMIDNVDENMNTALDDAKKAQEELRKKQ